MSAHRCVNLWVDCKLLDNGYFVLSDLVLKLPKDTSVKFIWNSHSSNHQVLRLESKHFPEIPTGDMPPRAEYEYNVNSGPRIIWPTREHEDIMLKLLNNDIEASVNKDAEVMENEGAPSAEALKQMQIEYIKMMNGTPPYRALQPTGCNHEWFAYGRTAATKHCKKCGMVSENKVDNS